MHNSISQFWRSAEKRLDSSPDEISKGLELHKKLFTCDSFGFLPSTWSKKACQNLKKLIEENSSYDDIAGAKGLLSKLSSIYDENCQKAFLEAIKASGVNCTVLTMGSEMDLHHSLHRMSWYTHMFDMMKDSLIKVTSSKDIDEARNSEKLAVICSTNNAPVFGGIDNVTDAFPWIDIFYRLGIRIMHLTYNRRNWVGDGCLEPSDAGLSLHGRDVVRHLNRIGMVIDTPHTGKKTTLDAAELSSAPIMATHTTCQRIYGHPRGKSDEELKAIAATGGFIGICAIPPFLGEAGDINTLLDHIEHAVDVAGIDHIGIGTDTAWQMPMSDSVPEDYFPLGASRPLNSKYTQTGAWDTDLHFKYNESLPVEYQESLKWVNWPYFTVGLKKRGYSDSDIAKITGENFIRVFSEIQKRSESPA
jgi:membrane dipeptidase